MRQTQATSTYFGGESIRAGVFDVVGRAQSSRTAARYRRNVVGEKPATYSNSLAGRFQAADNGLKVMSGVCELLDGALRET